MLLVLYKTWSSLVPFFNAFRRWTSRISQRLPRRSKLWDHSVCGMPTVDQRHGCRWASPPMSAANADRYVAKTLSRLCACSSLSCSLCTIRIFCGSCGARKTAVKSSTSLSQWTPPLGAAICSSQSSTSQVRKLCYSQTRSLAKFGLHVFMRAGVGTFRAAGQPRRNVNHRNLPARIRNEDRIAKGVCSNLAPF